MERMRRIVALIQERPGLRQVDIARALGIRPCAVYVALPNLEARGVLLAEDETGRLYIAEQGG